MKGKRKLLKLTDAALTRLSMNSNPGQAEVMVSQYLLRSNMRARGTGLQGLTHSPFRSALRGMHRSKA